MLQVFRQSRVTRAVAVAAVLLSCEFGTAQGLPMVQSGSDVTFQLLANAPYQSDYIASRVRRFLDDQGNLVQVREQLRLQGDGTKDSSFRLDFVDLVGAGAIDPSARTRWSETYRTNAGLLHFHGGFCVHDPVAAQRNYGIYDFGFAHRFGRQVRRVVVFPHRADKGIWVLDVDTMTGTSLYAAEYNSQLQLINELETTSLAITQSALSSGRSTSPTKPQWSWKPRFQVARHPTFDAAAATMSGVRLVQPAVGGIVTEYALNLVQVTEDPVNGDRTLVLGYTDGIDEFFVLQSHGSGDPFQGSPSMRAVKGTSAHAIASYDDPAMRVYAFHEDGVTFQVVGRGSLLRLKDVAMRLCQQVVTGF